MITRAAGIISSGFFSLGFGVLAIITLLPATASKPNLLGYYGVCSFAPSSTAILTLFAITSLMIVLRLKKPRSSA
jgi:hypothetical protein